MPTKAKIQTIYTTDNYYGKPRKRIVGHTQMSASKGERHFELVIRTTMRAEKGFGPEELKGLQMEIHELLKKYNLKIGGRKRNVF